MTDVASLAASVIIPVLDDASSLKACLEALRAQTLRTPFEVLVVDNGSADNPEALVRELGDERFLRELKPSSYAARNRGVQDARGEVLAFTDADCIPAPDWLERGVARVMAEKQPAFVAGRIDVFPENPGAPTLAERYEMLHAFQQRALVEEMHFGVTANLFVQREAFDRVGPFCGDLISSGDREWGQRAGERGLAAIYADDVVVRHPARRSVAQLRRKTRRLQVGLRQLRELRGESLTPAEMARPLVRPPIRTILHNLERLEPPSVRIRLSYAGLALALFYLGAVERVREAVSARLARA